MTSVTFRAWAIMIAYLVGTCASHAEDSLYVRLGGESGVAVIAGKLIDRVSVDSITGPSFEGTKLARIKKLLAEQICDLSGGPCHYSGDSMKRSHAGLHISQAMFYRMVQTLREVLAEQHVDQRATNQLLRLLAPMKRDVIEYATVPHAPASSTASGSGTAAASHTAQ